MTAASRKSPLWYAWNGIAAPRTATRALVGENEIPRTSYALFGMGLGASLMAGVVVALTAYLFFPSLHNPRDLLLGSGVQGIVFDNFLYASFLAATFPAALFLWNHLFGFKVKRSGVLAATSLGFGILVFVSPVQELAYVVLESLPFAAWLIVFGLNFAFFIGITSAFYSEALTLTFGRALLMNLTVTAMIVLALAFGALFLGYYFGNHLFRPLTLQEMGVEP